MLPLIHFKPVPAPCGASGHTQRAATKDLIRSLCQNNQAVFHHLASAMRTGKPQELWPAALEHDQIRKISKKEKPGCP
jgi:tRNA 2-thiocytidine biosynthesis protein TtcA